MQVKRVILKPVTRDIAPGAARDLLERIPRASLAYAGDHGPQAQSIALVWRQGRYLAGISANAARRPGTGQEVVLLIDAGVHFFDLRALYIRAHAQPAEAPRGAPVGHVWLEVVPFKTVAWGYGALREVEEVGVDA
jgi:hypothetical protein